MSQLKGPAWVAQWAVGRPKPTAHRPSRPAVTCKGAGRGRWPYAIGGPGRQAVGEAAAAGACGAGLRRAAAPAKPDRPLLVAPALSNPSR